MQRIGDDLALYVPKRDRVKPVRIAKNGYDFDDD
jgi:hypothetical protein